MGILSADQILAASDMKHVDIDVPEWGGSVRLRVMSGTDRNAFEREWSDATEQNKAGGGKGIPMFRERLIARCACNEKGERIFTDEQVAALGNKNAIVLDKLARACLDVNGFSKESSEELAKN